MKTKKLNRIILVATITILLLPALSCYGQADKKTLFFISNTHLDTQWNWDVKTTIGEYIPRTLTQNMALMDKYPAFNLNYEGAIKYMWMKEYYPAEYEQMKEYIARGQWHVSGMSLDATDVMMSSAESILHSMLYANKFYMNEFGVRGGYDIMLPDCFGFSYALPSLARHTGIKGFHTAKLGWGSAAYDQLGDFGVWQGVDGSQIYAIYKPGAYDNHEDYNKDLTSDASILNEINSNYSKYGVAAEIRYVGPRGDRGGALQDNASSDGENTPYWLNYNAQKTNGKISVVLASPDEVFNYLDKYRNDKYQVWNDELPMRTHGVGAYTSRAELKMWNRRNELLADAAEKASSLAYWLGVNDYPTEALRDAWIKTIWQQHHDGITGTSIPRAYEYSENDYYLANKEFGKMLLTAVGATAQYLDTNTEGLPIVVYNPLSHDRTDVVEGSLVLGKKPEGLRVFDKNGEEVLSQINAYDEATGKVDFIFAATVPSLGYAVYDVRLGEASALTSTLTVDEDAKLIQNGSYSFKLNRNGDVYQLKDIQNGRSLMSTTQQQLIYDHEDTWPAWEISYTDVCRSPSGTVNENVEVTLVEDGPLRKSFRVQRTKEGSSFVQYVRMSALSNRIDLVNEVDWQSRERMLKVNFPFVMANSKTTYDISLGTITRGVRTSEHYEMQGHQWADHSAQDGSYGISILNDSKYGWDKPTNNSLRLTLLHTPSCGNYQHHAEQDLGPNNFTYSIFPHEGDWTRETQREAAHLNQPLVAFVATKHEGALGRDLAFVSHNTDGISVKALKKAEETDELIVRVYEWSGKDHDDVQITFPTDIQSVREVNALEEDVVDGDGVSVSGKTFSFSIGHYQPKTFAVRLQKNALETTTDNSTAVALDYNIDMMSDDAARGNASTMYTYAYPAEQIKDLVQVDGVSFTMGPRDLGKNNAVRVSTPQTITFTRQPGQDKLYLLMASGNQTGTEATVTAGGESSTFSVPYLSGYAGQAASSFNLGATYRTDNIALTTTHAHGVSAKSNETYRYMYMYKYVVPLPEGVNEVTITASDRKLLLFAASLSDTKKDDVTALTPITTTIDYKELGDMAACGQRLVPSSVKYSHQNGTNEGAAKANDLDANTKWCVVGDKSKTPYLEYDFADEVEICQWMVLHAGIESSDYITKAFKLQYYTADGNWQDVDVVNDNTANKTLRGIEPVRTTRVRLQIEQGEQNGSTTRIYEFAVYGSDAATASIQNVADETGDGEESIYTIDGVKIDKLRPGINILRSADGTTRKVLVQ